MAVAAQAALLDELMGKGRNVSLNEAKVPHWSDEDICKFFLAGLCPHDLFNNTKDDLGQCEKAHDESLLKSYQKSKRFGEMRYEEKLCSFLRELISSVESRIRRGENRLQKNGNLVHSFYNSEREDTLKQLNGKIEETLAKVEELGTNGEVQESRVWLEVAEKLKNEKIRLEKSMEVYNQQAKELEICQVCGAFQVKGDAHQRIEEHLQGKMHLGYAQIREYLSTHSIDRNKTNTNNKTNRCASDEKDKIKIDPNTKKKERSNEHVKEQNNGSKNNEEHQGQVEETESNSDYCSEWDKEQCKVQEKSSDSNERNKNNKEERKDTRERHRDSKERYHDNKDSKERHRDNKEMHKDSKERHRDNKEMHKDSKERHHDNKGMHKDSKKDAKDRKRKRSSSNHKHRSDVKHSHRSRDSERHRSKHSTSRRRSKSPKRHVNR